MKTLFTICMALLCFGAKAQMLTDKKDEFTGKPVKAATVSLLQGINTLGGFYQVLSFGQQSDKKMIVLSMSLPSGQFGAFNGLEAKNMSILLKMENDTIVKIKADPQLSNIANSGMASLLVIGNYISDDQLRYLTSNKVKVMRVAYTQDETGYDIKLSGNKARQIEKASTFMLGMTWFDEPEAN